jgi:hypothetical protein
VTGKPLPLPPESPGQTRPVSREQPNALPRSLPDSATYLPRGPNVPASWATQQTKQDRPIAAPPPPALGNQAVDGQGQVKEDKPKEKRTWKKLFNRG